MKWYIKPNAQNLKCQISFYVAESAALTDHIGSAGIHSDNSECFKCLFQKAGKLALDVLGRRGLGDPVNLAFIIVL